MSNLATHEAEQAALTALCEAGECGHPHCDPSPIDRALEIMEETDDDSDNNTRRAARVLLAIAPAFDDDTTEAGIADALTNLMHLCDLAGWDFAEMQQGARRVYLMEIGELGLAADETLRLAIERN